MGAWRPPLAQAGPAGTAARERRRSRPRRPRPRRPPRWRRGPRGHWQPLARAHGWVTASPLAAYVGVGGSGRPWGCRGGRDGRERCHLDRGSARARRTGAGRSRRPHAGPWAVGRAGRSAKRRRRRPPAVRRRVFVVDPAIKGEGGIPGACGGRCPAGGQSSQPAVAASTACAVAAVATASCALRIGQAREARQRRTEGCRTAETHPRPTPVRGRGWRRVSSHCMRNNSWGGEAWPFPVAAGGERRRLTCSFKGGPSGRGEPPLLCTRRRRTVGSRIEQKTRGAEGKDNHRGPAGGAPSRPARGGAGGNVTRDAPGRIRGRGGGTRGGSPLPPSGCGGPRQQASASVPLPCAPNRAPRIRLQLQSCRVGARGLASTRGTQPPKGSRCLG